MSNEALGTELLVLARAAIDQHFGGDRPPRFDTAALLQPGACFVTLTKKGQLRGCIGSLEAWRPLAADVCENAVAAAFRDPRFPPLTADELSDTRVEVSLLTAPEAMTFSSEADALAQMRPEVDGIILECDGRRATFLPQVWEQLPEPWQFMTQLKLKAGLPADFWSHGDSIVKLWRYGVEKWKEPTTDSTRERKAS